MPSDLAIAIAEAEGFGLDNAIPTLAHNPGDLVLGDVGYGVRGAAKITNFPDDATGWAALEDELTRIRNEEPAHHQLPISHVYSYNDTIWQLAQHWTTTEQTAWAHNVVDGLARHGIMASLTTRLVDVLG